MLSGNNADITGVHYSISVHKIINVMCLMLACLKNSIKSMTFSNRLFRKSLTV